jgi:hypothetical protein
MSENISLEISNLKNYKTSKKIKTIIELLNKQREINTILINNLQELLLEEKH